MKLRDRPPNVKTPRLATEALSEHHNRHTKPTAAGDLPQSGYVVVIRGGPQAGTWGRYPCAARALSIVAKLRQHGLDAAIDDEVQS